MKKIERSEYYGEKFLNERTFELMREKIAERFPNDTQALLKFSYDEMLVKTYGREIVPETKKANIDFKRFVAKKHGVDKEYDKYYLLLSEGNKRLTESMKSQISDMALTEAIREGKIKKEYIDFWQNVNLKNRKPPLQENINAPII